MEGDEDPNSILFEGKNRPQPRGLAALLSAAVSDREDVTDCISTCGIGLL